MNWVLNKVLGEVEPYMLRTTTTTLESPIKTRWRRACKDGLLRLLEGKGWVRFLGLYQRGGDTNTEHTSYM